MANSILKLNPETNSIIILIVSLRIIPRFHPTPKKKKASENSEVLKSEQVVSLV